MMTINFFIGIVLIFIMGYFAYMSSVLVSEKKERQRRGLTDYYDNPISQFNSNRSQINGAKRKKQNANASAEGLVFDKSKVKYFDGDNT